LKYLANFSNCTKIEALEINILQQKCQLRERCCAGWHEARGADNGFAAERAAACASYPLHCGPADSAGVDRLAEVKGPHRHAQDVDPDRQLVSGRSPYMRNER